MLSRRYLRIKAMQALYAFFSDDQGDLAKSERALLQSVDKIYDLYVYLLLILVEIRDQASKAADEAKNKRLPTKEDLAPNTRFIDNKLLHQLVENEALNREAQKRSINWAGEDEMIRRIFVAIRSGEEYKAYMSSPNNNYDADKNFVLDVFEKYIAQDELLHHFFEEKNIHWGDDVWMVAPLVAKTILGFNENAGKSHHLMRLYKDETDDKQFLIELFRKAVMQSKENESYIAQKTKNWEVERIATMDILLMKMALTELQTFDSIPVKVTLNEYIEISKMYSTPKSRVFINGILDKLVVELKEQSKIVKVGRGLVE